MRLLCQGHGLHLGLLRDLDEFRITLQLELLDRIQKLLFLDAGLLEKLILGAALLNHGHHHHFHLALLRHLIHIHHTRVLHHLLHLLHLDILLRFESLEYLLAGQHGSTGSRLLIFLYLHHSHLLIWLLRMVNSIFLELLLIDIKLLHDLLQFGVYDLLLLLSHLNDDFLVLLGVINDLPTPGDEIFLLSGEFTLGVIGADLENLDELLELDVACSVSLEVTK